MNMNSIAVGDSTSLSKYHGSKIPNFKCDLYSWANVILYQTPEAVSQDRLSESSQE